jgi:hypothetical protein
MTALTPAATMATMIIEPENLSRMMVSFCPEVSCWNGLLQRDSPSHSAGRIVAFFGIRR